MQMLVLLDHRFEVVLPYGTTHSNMYHVSLRVSYRNIKMLASASGIHHPACFTRNRQFHMAAFLCGISVIALTAPGKDLADIPVKCRPLKRICHQANIPFHLRRCIT